MQRPRLRLSLPAALLFLVSVCAAAQESSVLAQSPDDKPAKLQFAEVAVASAGAQPMTEETKWTKLPAYLEKATIFDKEPTGRALDLTIKPDGIVIIAASWSYDGNESGGWLEGRTGRNELVAAGWVPMAEVVSTDKGTHTLFFKEFKKGDKVSLHTRKYNQPFVVSPAAEKLPDVQKAIVEARANFKTLIWCRTGI